MTSRTRRVVPIVVALAALLGFGIYWFGPQRLVTDRVADEALPTGGPASPGAVADATPDDQDAFTTLAEGTFRSLAHETTGTAKLVTTAEGTFLRIEALDSLDGPDLRVYLTSSPADGDDGSFGDAALVADLGDLRANQGNLTYEIPDSVELGEVASVSIWCRRFSVGFGVAGLEPTG